jgi:pimeloyl-ACP methyl ester carboxylesterase
MGGHTTTTSMIVLIFGLLFGVALTSGFSLSFPVTTPALAAAAARRQRRASQQQPRTPSATRYYRRGSRTASLWVLPPATAAAAERRFYDYDGITCSYEYQRIRCNPASESLIHQKKKNADTRSGTADSAAATAKSKTFLLIHPVGIGMGNWFWDKFRDEAVAAAAASTGQQQQQDDDDEVIFLYAINLIGCGRSRQSGTVDDDYFLARTTITTNDNEADQDQMILPWTRQCAYFVDEIILQQKDTNDSDSTTIQTAAAASSSSSTEITVISHGGLAPIALQLATLRPHAIANIVLASPPTLQQLQQRLSVTEAMRNWDQLRKLPDVCFTMLLESKWAIRFFSNLFLFDRKCDNVWRHNAQAECDRSVRAPVRYFNAGLCEVPGVLVGWNTTTTTTIADATVTSSTPPPRPRILVVRGDGDRRIDGDDFGAVTTNTKTAATTATTSTPRQQVTIVVVPNANKVVPWEAPGAFLAAVQSFLRQGGTE